MSERSNYGGFAPDTPTERLETLRRKPESFLGWGPAPNGPGHRNSDCAAQFGGGMTEATVVTPAPENRMSAAAI